MNRKLLHLSSEIHRKLLIKKAIMMGFELHVFIIEIETAYYYWIRLRAWRWIFLTLPSTGAIITGRENSR